MAVCSLTALNAEAVRVCEPSSVADHKSVAIVKAMESMAENNGTITVSGNNQVYHQYFPESVNPSGFVTGSGMNRQEVVIRRVTLGAPVVGHEEYVQTKEGEDYCADVTFVPAAPITRVYMISGLSPQSAMELAVKQAAFENGVTVVEKETLINEIITKETEIKSSSVLKARLTGCVIENEKNYRCVVSVQP